MTTIISQTPKPPFRSIPCSPTYFISPTGVVTNRRYRPVAPYEISGYAGVKLPDSSGRRKSHLVHRLVVETFIGPIPPKMWVNHKDGDKHNNAVENLEVVSPSTIFPGLPRRAVGGIFSPAGTRAVKLLLQAGWLPEDIAKAFNVAPSTARRIAKRVKDDVVLDYE